MRFLDNRLDDLKTPRAPVAECTRLASLANASMAFLVATHPGLSRIILSVPPPIDIPLAFP